MISVDCNNRVRCCFIQLYSNLQPANAEPLSIEKLASVLSHSLPDTFTQLYTIDVLQPANERATAIEQILEAKYDLIGLSCPQGTYELAHEILALLYMRHPPQVILGHALPTMLPDYFLRSYPRALIVRGWGEEAILTLCRQIQARRLQPELVPGLTYIDEKGVRRDNEPSWNDLPGVTRRATPHRYFARVEASRGCHYNICTFCSRPPRAQHQAPWKRRDMSAVLADIENLVQAGITTFTFTDEDFIGNDPHGALELAEHLRNFPALDFALSVRADNVVVPDGSVLDNQLRKRIFHTLKEAGLTLVFVGIESFAPTQLRRFGKGVSPEINIHVLHILESLDIELEIGLILFDPLVTLEELQTNITILKETGFWRYSGQIFSFLRPQVGTPYVTLLRHHNLLGELQVNTAEYTASYQDHRVSQIVQQCKIWNRKYQHMYMMLRNSSRSDLGTGGFKQALERYRSVQLRFLESALSHLPEKNDETFAPFHHWGREIASIAQDIYFAFQTRLPRSAAERELYKSASRLFFAEGWESHLSLNVYSEQKLYQLKEGS
jgi:radical SAM superfamily enzyme YgiQ (UPF0313 family)